MPLGCCAATSPRPRPRAVELVEGDVPSRSAASALTTPVTIPWSTACWTSAVAGGDAGPHVGRDRLAPRGRTQNAPMPPARLTGRRMLGEAERRPQTGMPCASSADVPASTASG